jgi:hypothetical protein
MASVNYAYESEDELEALSELEDESEWEDELEDEAESEAFYGRLARLARRKPRSKALSRLATKAARAAMSSFSKSACDGESECEAEGEDEDEAEGEFEAGLNPIRRIYQDALMEHLGHAATSAESEAEAEAFVGALMPLAAKVLPKLGKVVMKAMPHLVKGVARVTRTLRQNPKTRQLVRTMPELARRTVRSLAHRVAHGKPLTGRAAVRSLARHTAHLLGHPKRVVHTYRRSRALHRHHHGVGFGPHRAAGHAPRIHPGHVRRRRYGYAYGYPGQSPHARRRRRFGPGGFGMPGWKYWHRLGARPGVIPTAVGGAVPAAGHTVIPGVRRRRRYVPSAAAGAPHPGRHRRRRTCGCGCCCGGCGCGR